MNFMYASVATAILCVLILEFSFSNYYLNNQYLCLLLLFMFSKGFNLVLYHQLQDVILCMPAASALAFFTQVSMGGTETTYFSHTLMLLSILPYTPLIHPPLLCSNPPSNLLLPLPHLHSLSLPSS